MYLEVGNELPSITVKGYSRALRGGGYFRDFTRPLSGSGAAEAGYASEQENAAKVPPPSFTAAGPLLIVDLCVDGARRSHTDDPTVSS